MEPPSGPLPGLHLPARMKLLLNYHWPDSNLWHHFRSEQRKCPCNKPSSHPSFSGGVFRDDPKTADRYLAFADENFPRYLNQTTHAYRLDFWIDAAFKTKPSNKSRREKSQGSAGLGVIFRSLPPSTSYELKVSNRWVKRMYYLRNARSNNEAELFAIAEALTAAIEECKNRLLVPTDFKMPTTVVVHTDSVYALSSIRRHGREAVKYDKVIGKICCCTHILQFELGIDVELRWIPTHAGIEGLMEAEETARMAVKGEPWCSKLFDWRNCFCIGVFAHESAAGPIPSQQRQNIVAFTD